MMPAIGYAIREQNRPYLDDWSIDAAEITFERADDPLRVNRYIEQAEFEKVSVHALKLSVASPDPPHHEYVEAVKSVAWENGATSVSDHLGFTRDGDDGVEIGHFSAPPYTNSALSCTCRNIDHVQRAVGDLRFYIENIAYLFRYNGTMTEAEFLTRVLRTTGCGWLLDVTNVYANSINFGYDPYEFIAEVMPAASDVQMHLAGGYFDERLQKYIDSHSHPIPEPVYALYRHALKLADGKVEAVFIERDQDFPDENGWRDEVRTVRRIADECVTAAA
jgi:uncharacterized protein (UPF0276 family)